MIAVVLKPNHFCLVSSKYSFFYSFLSIPFSIVNEFNFESTSLCNSFICILFFCFVFHILMWWIDGNWKTETISNKWRTTAQFRRNNSQSKFNFDYISHLKIYLQQNTFVNRKYCSVVYWIYFVMLLKPLTVIKFFVFESCIEFLYRNWMKRKSEILLWQKKENKIKVQKHTEWEWKISYVHFLFKFSLFLLWRCSMKNNDNKCL